MSTTNLSNETFKNQMQTTEKVHYKGELRIIGQIVNTLSDKDPIGYVIMVEKTQQFKPYTVTQTISLLQRFKFVNAAIENGKIINTECSMQRLPKFNQTLTVIGNFGIIVLGEITDGTNKIGYRVMDTNAKIVDLSEIELLNYTCARGVEILNAKIVSRNNKQVVSAIKQEFTKIEKSKLPQTKRRKNPKEVWRHEMHVKKLKDYAIVTVLNQLFTKTKIEYININDNWYWRCNNDSSVRKLEVEKEFKIFCTEIATAENNCVLSNDDKALLKRLSSIIPYQSSVCMTDYEKITPDTKRFVIGFLQFALNNKDIYDKVYYGLIKNRRGLSFGVVKYMIDTGIACDSLKKLNKAIIKHMNDMENAKIVSYNKEKEKEFKTSTFLSAKDIAQLGFTISSENKNMKYTTEAGFHKTLLYLGDIITTDYDYYKKQSRCFGDLASIAYIEKLFGILDETKTKGKVYGLTESSMIDCINLIATLAYMYGSTAMKSYVEKNSNKFDYYGISLPDFDEVSNTDYKLSKELIMYYSSGFNVFLSDADNYNYKKIYLKEAKLINYRQMGISHNIIHPLLQDELASVVSLISPETLSAESITKFIGNIRFL